MTDEDAVQQIEETEVLMSIYEGDENFKQIDDTTYQYKFSEGPKSFILVVTWGPRYPTEKPYLNVDIFYNLHLLPPTKEKILKFADAEAEQWLGCAMTYSIFECIKEKLTEIFADQPEDEPVSTRVAKITIEDKAKGKKKGKKGYMTKAQKRRAWDKAEMGHGGDKPRGSDWVDVIKHLSQVPPQRKTS